MPGDAKLPRGSSKQAASLAQASPANDRRQPDHEPGAAFVLMMAGTQKHVIVRPLVD
jgi:hypothetical protein